LGGWKHARQWISQKLGMGWSEGGPLELDENGWGGSLAVDQYVENVIMTAWVIILPAGTLCSTTVKGRLSTVRHRWILLLPGRDVV